MACFTRFCKFMLLMAIAGSFVSAFPSSGHHYEKPVIDRTFPCFKECGTYYEQCVIKYRAAFNPVYRAKKLDECVQKRTFCEALKCKDYLCCMRKCEIADNQCMETSHKSNQQMILCMQQNSLCQHSCTAREMDRENDPHQVYQT
uniref:Cnidarian restricted protein n=1 Tax=Clytia hemisphaerica TaxID=252671 RepID=A0A7M5TYF2_9CNID